MESNISKGVEAIMELAETIREHLNSVGYALGEDTTNLIAQVLKIDGERIGFALAHPQQSEGVEVVAEELLKSHPDYKAEGLLRCPFCGKEPMEGMTGGGQYIIKCWGCGLVMSHDRQDKVRGHWNQRSSEPAAPKEPQGSAPAVVITDGEMEKMAHRLWLSRTDINARMTFDEFTAALKEFASLLNQKR